MVFSESYRRYLRYYIAAAKSMPQASFNSWSIILAGVLLTSELIRAARALLRWEQRNLSEASSVSLPTIKRLEAKRGTLIAHSSTIAALRNALEKAGVEFIDENGGGLGVRLRKRSIAAKHK
jgi:hypothetical protein